MIMLPVEIKVDGVHCGDDCVGLREEDGTCRFFPDPLDADQAGYIRHTFCIIGAQ